MRKYATCSCGSTTFLKHRIVSRNWYEKKWFIECDYCHFCSKSAYTEKGAIRNWNKAHEWKEIKDES